jgi:hypothetical protein
MYTRAKEQQQQRWAEEIIEISDDDTLDPNARRVRVDSRKWLLSKLLPKQYGDRVEINATVSRAPVELTDVELARIAAEGMSALSPSNAPLIEHQPDPAHTSAPTHDDNTAASGNGNPREKSGQAKPR